MKHKPALYALLRLHAEFAAEIKANKEQAHTLRMNLWHVGTVINLIDPTINLKKIAPKKKRSKTLWFERGECVQGTLDVLRNAPNPLSARQIALVLLERRGISNAPKKLIDRTAKAVYANLLHRRGKSVVTGDEMKPVRWSLRA
jgi:hypothetical protein